MTEQRSEKHDADRNSLSDALKPVFDDFVVDYRFFATKHHGAQSLVLETTERYGKPVSVRPRLGQGLFSLAVRDAYEGACAITHEHSMPALEAVHIKPYGQGGEHRVSNGLLLRRDLHRLYDLGYVTVTPDYVFSVGNRLRDEYNNGKSYYGLHGSEIGVPSRETLRPDKALLEWHCESVFGG